MPLLIHLRHLDRESLHLAGELPAADLDLAGVDEVIKLEAPLKYDLNAEKHDKNILVQGTLDLTLECECVRCLKPFKYRLLLEDWACLLPLEGEEKAVVTNDSVDLTPAVREDILLGFPQHPLCKAECGGLPKKAVGRTKTTTDGAGQAKQASPAWAELNKLKFK